MPDPAVLDHVEPTEAVGADHAVELADERLRGEAPAVERDRDARLEADHELGGLGAVGRVIT